jgi:DNA-binding transcriptional regulator PaaX
MKSKNKKQNKKNNLSDVKEKIENFFYSDSVSANATRFLLMFFALGGVAFGGAIIPGLIKILGKLDLSEKKTGYDKNKIANALGNLKRQKLIEIVKEKNGKTTVKLTNKGLRRVRQFSIDTLTIKKPRRWDGKWRILIFDIPSKPKKFNVAREALRRKIKKLKFFQLQKSVWVQPYECEDEILFVAEAYQVQRYVEIITAEKILHEKKLKKIFKI